MLVVNKLYISSAWSTNRLRYNMISDSIVKMYSKHSIYATVCIYEILTKQVLFVCLFVCFVCVCVCFLL